jgi:SAM-dependent methyltransferase
MAYADITVDDPNPVKRWIQRQRFRDALNVLRQAGPTDTTALLDFGGGDGELLRQALQIFPRLRACFYEPTPSLFGEAQAKLAHWPDIRMASETTAIGGRFDFVFCLEVFEHLPHRATQEAIVSIHEFLKPQGLAVIGVPHEIFAPALLKGLFRMARRYGAYDARPGNILRAAVGRPPTDRPVQDICPGFSYHHYHLGFDYRNLERRLRERFSVVSRWFSPVRVLGPALNSEVYYLLRRADSA